jgi:hypothetical protein
MNQTMENFAPLKSSEKEKDKFLKIAKKKL